VPVALVLIAVGVTGTAVVDRLHARMNDPSKGTPDS
jgi:hypothetical protein